MNTKEEENMFYGIIPGPRYTNTDGKYICTFECTESIEGKWYNNVYDLRVYKYADYQSFILVYGNDKPDYYSGVFSALLSYSESGKCFKQAINILLNLGKFTWTKRKNKL